MLGVQINRDRSKGTLSISQAKYISDVLDKFGMTDAYESPTPLTAGLKLVKVPANESLPTAEKEEIIKIPYK